MARKLDRLTTVELEIMQVLWREGPSGLRNMVGWGLSLAHGCQG